jgi:flagellar biosynthesis/type III secretory pathway protein FliH
MGRVLRSAGRIVPAGVVTAKAEAAAILDAARARAAALDATQEAVRQEAWRAGLEAGRAAADALYTERVAAAAVEVARLRTQAEPVALKLAGAIAARMAERMVGRAVDLDPGAMVEIAGRALGSARARGGIVKLRVHPDDLAALDQDPARAHLRSRLASAAELRLVADASVGRYGCVVETATARLDARLDTQIAALEKAFGDEASRG